MAQLRQRQALQLQQFELDQHLRRVLGVLARVAHEALQALPRVGQRWRHVSEHAAVAWDHRGRCQGFDQVQRGGDLIKGLDAVQLRKHDAKAAFPQRVG